MPLHNPDDTQLALPLAWEDLAVSLSTARVPAVSAPEWVNYAFGVPGGVAFAVLSFDVNEYLDFYVQTTHAMALNSVLNNHIHYSLPANDAGKRFKFQLDVLAAPIGSAFAVPAGAPYSAEHIIAADEANKHFTLDLADIPAVNSSLSTVYLCRLKRVAAAADEYGQAVYVLFDDSHYVRDTLGSSAEYIK